MVGTRQIYLTAIYEQQAGSPQVQANVRLKTTLFMISLWIKVSATSLKTLLLQNLPMQCHIIWVLALYWYCFLFLCTADAGIISVFPVWLYFSWLYVSCFYSCRFLFGVLTASFPFGSTKCQNLINTLPRQPRWLAPGHLSPSCYATSGWGWPSILPANCVESWAVLLLAQPLASHRIQQRLINVTDSGKATQLSLLTDIQLFLL